MTREEAIGIVKTQYSHDAVMKTALGMLIPELRESEDEWIPKELIEYLKQKGDYRCCWIAWLEKQKDAFENGRQFGIMQEQARQELELPNEKQEEQKPISFNESYNPDEYEVVIEGNATSLKRKEQKPVKSNEEDDELRYYIYEAIQTRYSDRELSKYFNPKIIGEKMELRRKIFAFLRNLVPSWKPTAAQMKGLKFFLDFHRPQRNAGTVNWKEFDAVESLYEQLKKL